MPRQRTAYRPTPTNPNVPGTAWPKTAAAAIEDLDDFLDEIDDILTEEEAFAVNFRQRGGQ